MSAEPSRACGVVVTGAARGMGAVIARTFAAEGYAVVGVDLAEPGLRSVFDALGAPHTATVGDVVNEELLARACATGAAIGGGLRCVVVNAGISDPGATPDYAAQRWDTVLDVNLKAAFLAAKHAAPLLGPGGSIVMLSSIVSALGFAERAAYGASKAGVNGLVIALATEFGSRGIRVNAVAPGSIDTDMLRAMVATGRVDEGRYTSRIPMGRLGRPEEIADAVAYLASDRASYVNGQVLHVDGGWSTAGLPARFE